MINIPITFHSDEKGYFDRECPNNNCLYTFKVSMRDWEEKIKDEVHCPMCGHIDITDNWWTQEQLKHMEKIAADWAMSYIQCELGKSFKKLERGTKQNKFVKLTYKPGRRITFTNNPLGQSPEWERDIECPKCNMRYSVIGSAYFCPNCGLNNLEETFDDALDSIAKMIESLPEMETFLIETQGRDKAKTICRSMLESSLGEIISTFQKFAELRYRAISPKTIRVNDFQIVDKGSRLFEEATGANYSDWISETDLFFMNLMFQRRHVMVHNGGLVDDQYIQKSLDTSYAIGQRLVIREDDVIKLIRVIETLAKGIRSL